VTQRSTGLEIRAGELRIRFRRVNPAEVDGAKKKKDEQARHLSGGLWPLLWVNTIKETEKQQLKGARIFSEPIARAAVSGLISAA